MDEIRDFLPCPTPQSWVDAAVAQLDVLLIDHANCEKKAAGTALSLMYHYGENMVLMNKLSRLAREELRHFEQVLAILQKRNIPYRKLSASRYAGGLRKVVRTHEPARLVDTLLVGAYIEARSCERFAEIAPHLDQELAQFYTSLLKSESRHYRDYLSLARQASSGDEVERRLTEIAEKEQQLIQDTDKELRFHSGPPG